MSVDIERAADDVFDLQQHGAESTGPAPVVEVGDRLSDALHVQVAVLRRWMAAGDALGGWKIGMTSRDARDSMGRDFRPFGFLRESRMFPSGASLDRMSMGVCLVEPEIGLVVGRRISGPNVTRDEARDAVSAVVPSLEIVERRLPPESPRALRIADGLGQWGTVFGAERARDVDLHSLEVQLFHDGESVATGTAGPDVVDDPFLSLSRVCAVLAEFGLSIERGQRLITGSLLPPMVVERSGTWRAEFGDLGSVAVTFR